jgi:hypothetical protein
MAPNHRGPPSVIANNVPAKTALPKTNATPARRAHGRPAHAATTNSGAVWRPRYRAPVSHQASASGATRASRACAPKAPAATATKPSAHASWTYRPFMGLTGSATAVGREPPGPALT